MIKEIWKPVKGYEGIYEVSNTGIVRSLDRVVMNRGRSYKVKGKTLKQYPNNKGYLRVDLRKKGTSKEGKIHRLVAIHHLGGIDNEKGTVNHKDGIKTNNNAENLEWMTLKENMNHAYENNLKYTKYGADIILKVKKLRRDTNLTQKEIGKIFGMKPQYVSSILNNSRRKNVKEGV